MEKIWFPVILSLLVLGGFVYAYDYFDNQNLQKEYLEASIYYQQNVTSVESAEILLDFSNQRMKIESTFQAEGYHIGLDTGSRGFQNRDSSCSNSLDMIFVNDKQQGRVWDSRDIIEFENIGIIDKVELQKICAFSKKLEPNGEFIVHLFGKNQTLGVDIKEIPFTMIFDSDDYRCEEYCVFSEQFDIIDIENDDNKTIVRAIAKNPDTKRMEFNFRTTNFTAERNTSIFFVLIQVGIGATLTMVVYALTTRQQNKSKEILDEIHKLEQKQKEIIEEQEQSKQVRKKNAMSYLHINLMHLLSEVLYHREMLLKFYNVSWRELESTVSKEESTEKWIRMIKEQSIRIGENMRHVVLSSSDVLEPNLLHELNLLQNIAVKPFDLVPEQSSYDLMDCDGQIDWIVSILKEYFDYSDEQLKNMGVSDYELE